MSLRYVEEDEPTVPVAAHAASEYDDEPEHAATGIVRGVIAGLCVLFVLAVAGIACCT